ncbi:MAG TPA: ATP-dependent DNA helicase RecG [Patescibacteria group bacterium]|nr:ATP-dependent DNA helicase RecG [Patescibacteria group bacterium]
MIKKLDDSVRYLKGIGPGRAKLLHRLGIASVEDLLYYFPRRYEDRTNFTTISALQEGQIHTIKGKVLTAGARRSFRRRGFSIVEALVEDATGTLACVWFNQPYLKEYFKPGQYLVLYGKVDRYAGRLQMSAPEFELVSDETDSLEAGRIVPVYSLPEGMTQRYFRQIVKTCLDEYLPSLADFLPYDIRTRHALLNLAKAVINIHFPEGPQPQQEAHRRLSFEGFFLFQIPLALRKLRAKEKKGLAHRIDGELADAFIKGLPFALTASQKKVIDEIKTDMAKPQVMQRLLQGDVGSGKTVVATVAMLVAVQGGYQAAILVPTEILAKQHYDKVRLHLAGLGLRVKMGLLVSSGKPKEKEKLYQQIRQGGLDIVVGTHALLEETVAFRNLGLVVIDEQHKFGVAQRALLPQKGAHPDVLIMTATPIPRTLAITIYGDLDISVITELPAGRKPVVTKWVGPDKREWLYGFIRQQVEAGRQAYVVYPLIEESYKLDLLSAEKMYVQFKKNIFKECTVGLIHGKLKETEQDKIMTAFEEGKIQILIATTVLEVGIDVANASVMVVEHAERFGLSQLHQLRGRIGRGPYESFCVLVSGAGTPEAKARLTAMTKHSDGFAIAEEDLRIRGPGEFFGRRQHGLGELGIADPLSQMQLLREARQEAIKLIAGDPGLQEKQNAQLKEKLAQRFPEYDNLMVVG